MKRSMNAFVSATLAVVMMPVAISAFTGCQQQRTDSFRAGEPMLSLHQTAREIFTGEIVTVTAESRNLLGRDADIRWSTTGGELDTEDEGRTARVRFDRPGTYVISAQMFVDGELEQTESITVNVRALTDRDVRRDRIDRR